MGSMEEDDSVFKTSEVKVSEDATQIPSKPRPPALPKMKKNGINQKPFALPGMGTKPFALPGIARKGVKLPFKPPAPPSRDPEAEAATAAGAKPPPPNPVAGAKPPPGPPPGAQRNKLQQASPNPQPKPHPPPPPFKKKTEGPPLENNTARAEAAKIENTNDSKLVEELGSKAKDDPSAATVNGKSSASPVLKSDKKPAIANAGNGKKGSASPRSRLKIKAGKKKPKKVKKGFMLKLDGIFAGGGPPGMRPGGGPPPWKKKIKTEATNVRDSTESESNVDQKIDVEDVKIISKDTKKAEGKAAEKPKEQNLNVVERKPKMAGGRKKRKKKKFNPKKTAFSAQAVREYKKTDYKASALKLTEKQRVEVMMMVKNGNISVDEAMQAVLAHDKNVREALADNQTPDVDGKKKKFDKKAADFTAADLNKLSDEQRLKVMNLVKDGKMTVPQAIASVSRSVGKRADEKRRKKPKKDLSIKTPMSKKGGVSDRTPTIGNTTTPNRNTPTSNRKGNRTKEKLQDESCDEKAPGSCCTLM
mmetsp:Transcript_46543/g.74824  ORF Transcript_46543/g.74824 Transcript_46543/m.74824 type:complete len:532 (+) Transcript_46543:74-1669(+)